MTEFTRYIKLNIMDWIPYMALDLLPFILSIFFLRKAKPEFWKLFIYFFGFIFFNEVYFFLSFGLLSVIGEWVNHFAKVFYYLNFLNNTIILYVFCKIFQMKYSKLASKFILTIFIIIIGLHLKQTFYKFHITIYSGIFQLKPLIIVVFSLLIFYELIKEEGIKKIIMEERFWFVTGCLCYYTLPFRLLEKLPKYYNAAEKSEIYLFPSKVNFIMVNLMYLVWMIGFYFIRKKTLKNYSLKSNS